MRQSIRLSKTSDGVTLAWAEAGKGPTLIKGSNWLTHLEYDWDSPVWRHWLHFLADHYRLIRYDDRGCGMSEWDAQEITFEKERQDLELVIEVSQPEKPFTLLGISQGGPVAIQYAGTLPDNVAHLVLQPGACTEHECDLVVVLHLQQEALGLGAEPQSRVGFARIGM